VDPVVLTIFVLVYVGMILGGLPGLAVDRSGIVLRGAIAILASGGPMLEEAALAVDAHTIALLFGLMVMSAQFRLGGFYRTCSLANRCGCRSRHTCSTASSLATAGVDLARPEWLFTVTPVLSNLVSNVPAVMLLLPGSTGPQAGAVLALASTFAGNLLIVGSIANIIVVEQARMEGVAIDWRVHARTGVPGTWGTLALAA
jgi:Na+/H+ antiporter NhaD/arsenite permease-like protein